MKKIGLLLLLALILIMPLIAEEVKIKPEHLTLETFKEKVFDYENNTKWNYKGELPAIIDFYADWCGPCKQVAPIMKELANEYDGKVLIYKVDTDAERELAGMFGIQSIPSILFIPVGEQPQMVTGALPKESFVKIIEDVLKVN
ncbi:MAG: thioredoxin [Candidatus Cloacimonetes bacterium]|nr:thioredoxin [Candidatus Cloacimonadota bacterium]